MLKHVLWALHISCAVVTVCTWAQSPPVDQKQQTQTIYKWTNALGQIQYTELPPPAGVTFETVRKTTAQVKAPDADPSQGQDALSQQLTEKDRQEQEQAQRAKQAVDDQRTKACEAATQNTTLLESDKPLIMADAKGAKTIMDTTQRAEALQKAKKDRDYYCNP